MGYIIYPFFYHLNIITKIFLTSWTPWKDLRNPQTEMSLTANHWEASNVNEVLKMAISEIWNRIKDTQGTKYLISSFYLWKQVKNVFWCGLIITMAWGTPGEKSPNCSSEAGLELKLSWLQGHFLNPLCHATETKQYFTLKLLNNKYKENHHNI